jgi:hypothetical protein
MNEIRNVTINNITDYHYFIYNKLKVFIMCVMSIIIKEIWTFYKE